MIGALTCLTTIGKLKYDMEGYLKAQGFNLEYK